MPQSSQRPASALAFQVLREEHQNLAPRVSRIFGLVTSAIHGILEAVAGVGIDREITFLAELVQLLSELLYIIGSDSLILRTE